MKKNKIAILVATVLTISCMNGTSLVAGAADFSSETELGSEEITEDKEETNAEATGSIEDTETAEDKEDAGSIEATEASNDENLEMQMEDKNVAYEDANISAGDETEELEEIEEGDIAVGSEGVTEFSDEINEEQVAEAGVNNTVGTAISLKTNAFYKNRLVNDSDVNWYKFSVSKAGNLSVTFKHDYIESGSTYWKISIYNSLMEEISWDSFQGNEVSQTTDKFGIPAGTYYIEVYSYFYSSIQYDMKINYTESTDWEAEVNDTYSQADVVEVNKTFYGALQTEDDSDWYQFSVPKAGKVSLTFKHNYMEAGNTYWKATIYDSSMNELTWYNFAGNTISDTTDSFGIPAGTYYIKVYNYFYSSMPYNMKVSYTESVSWETEINDTYLQADNVKLGQSINAGLQSGYDVDWYKFTVPKSSYISYTFSHLCMQGEGNTYWKTTIYEAKNMEEVDTYDFHGDKSHSSNRMKLSAGVYYIKVYNYFYSSLPYSIKLSVYKPSVSLSKTKITTGSSAYTGGYVRPSVSVKYGNTKLSKEKDYVVSYSKASKVGNVVTIKISGKGKYSGTVIRKVKITRKPVSQLAIKGVPFLRKYTGKSIRPTVTIYNGRTKLKKERDYIVSYGQNKKKGKGTIVIKGKGNYSGMMKKYFTIG